MRNLGTFTSVNAVWEAYPSGGMEGDYVTVNSVVFTWNKYFRGWESDGSNTDTTTAREMKDFWGDVNVQNNLTVAGTLRCHRAKFLELGLFGTLAALQAAYPNPEEDSWAYVIDSEDDTKADLYSFKNGSWTSTEAEVLITQTLDEYALKAHQGISSSDGDKTVAIKIENTTKNVIGAVAGSVTTSYIADGAVTSDKIASSTITAGKIQDDAVGTAKIADGAVTSAKLSSELQATIEGKLDQSDIGVSVVGTDDGSVGSDLIATDAVTNLKIADGAISENKIADGQIYNNHLTDRCVEENNLEYGSVARQCLSQEIYDMFCMLRSSGTWTPGPGKSVSENQIVVAYSASGTINIVISGEPVASGIGIVSYMAPENCTVGFSTTGTSPISYRIYDTLASVVAQLNS